MSSKASALKIIIFALTNIAVFMWLGGYFFRLSGGVVMGGVSGEVSAAAGESIFKGAGKCYSCHSFGDEGSAVRCPNFGAQPPRFSAPIGIRSAERKPGYTAIQYIVESIYDPNAYAVKGFPKNVMKPINRPPIALEDDEITSVVLYLLENSGIEVNDDVIAEVVKAQVPFAGAGREVEVASGPSAMESLEGDPEEGFYVFEEMKCFQCHLIAGADFDPGELTEEDLLGGVGPELTGIGGIQTYDYLLESILNPDAVVLPDPSPDMHYSGEGGSSKMPDFLDGLSVRQLADLVAYLQSLGNESTTEDPDE